MKIVVLDGRTLAPEREAWSGLDRFGELFYYDVSMPDKVAARAAGATILATNKTPLGQDLLDSLPELRFITVLATGFDCVDIAAARRRGISVSNVPVYGTDTVAQYVFALLLEMCHHVALHAEAVRAGEWTRQPDFSMRKMRLRELAGKTMGIVGYGRIGRRTGELAHAFGMNVLACSPGRASAVANTLAVPCQLDKLFAQSDVISLHCPLTPETTGLVNRERLKLVKSDAFLINTARGGLIVEADLAEALNAGRLAGAAVDVVSKEPVRAENPLLAARNCLVTPHIAWATDEARGRLMETTVANVAAFLAGAPINVVN